MVFVSDISPDAATTQNVKSGNGAGLRALSGGARFLGVILMLAAVGIWILSGPLWDPEIMLVRLGVSLLFMCLGMMLLHAGRDTLQDEIHIDRQADELRHVRRGRDGIARVIRSLALADIRESSIKDDILVLRGATGEIVMEVSGLNRDTLRTLDMGLAGK